ERLRFARPEDAMRCFLEPHGARAVGFKLKFDELVRPEWAAVRRRVEADRWLRIVFLQRRDLLRRYLAHQVVRQQTGITNVPAGGTPPDIAPFAVDIDDCLRDIAETRRRGHEFEAAFAAHASLQVEYEDLAADPQAQCERVFAFLGLEPAPVQVATERIVRAPPQALVRNHEELLAALRAAGEDVTDEGAAG